jgi:O-antigen ligase
VTLSPLALQRVVLVVTCAFFVVLMTVPKVPGPLLGVLALGGIYVLVRHGGLEPDERAYALVMAILPAFYVVSMLIHGWDERLLGRPLQLVLSIPVFVLLRRVVPDPRLVLGAAALGLLAALPGAVYERYVLGAERVFGIYSGGDFGNFAAVYAAVALVGLVLGLGQRPRKPRALVATLAVVLAGSAIALWSGSRTSWLILTIGLAAAWLVALRRPARVAIAAPVLLAAGLGVAALTTDLASVRLQRMVAEAQSYLDPAQRQSARSTSVGLRLESVRFGLTVIERAPVLGVGTVGYRQLLREAAARGEVAAEIQTFGLLHNLIIDHLVIGGLAGLVALLAFWVGLFRMQVGWLRRAADPLTRFFGIGLLLITASYLVIGFFGSMFGSSLGTKTVAMLWATFSAFAASGRGSAAPASAPASLSRAPR